jgi:hypothetical protein
MPPSFKLSYLEKYWGKKDLNTIKKGWRHGSSEKEALRSIPTTTPPPKKK